MPPDDELNLSPEDIQRIRAIMAMRESLNDSKYYKEIGY